MPKHSGAVHKVSAVHPDRLIAAHQPKQVAAACNRQRGGIAIMFGVLLLPITGICALALDMALVYNRKVEMHNLAKAIALSAARSLNGTASGINTAVANAATTANATRFKNFAETITWSDAALTFGTTANHNGPWMDSGAASSSASQVFYVRVDTASLSSAGIVQTILARVLSEDFASLTINSAAIAGRVDIAVAPLAICAMSNTPAAPRNNSAAYIELVEYGFRRGVSYDLMNLNPSGTSPVNFVINPLAMPGSTGAAADLETATVGPYACAGTLGIPRVTGGKIAVARPFPLDSLYRQLNSRFDKYDGGVCTPNGAPPDVNVKPYDYSAMVTPLAWLTTAPDGQTATMSASATRLETIADLPPPGGTAAKYGPLWAYAKAVAYSTYTASPIEPVNGYTTMSTAAWPALYGNQVAKSYPSSTPYKAGSGVNALKPSAANAPGMPNRRVLNVALLDCSAAPTSSATVLAVGKFFMTVPATPTVLAAEFAGTVPINRLTGNTEIFE
jgi:Flp pilus assembly protein TadG